MKYGCQSFLKVAEKSTQPPVSYYEINSIKSNPCSQYMSRQCSGNITLLEDYKNVESKSKSKSKYLYIENNKQYNNYKNLPWGIVQGNSTSYVAM